MDVIVQWIECLAAGRGPLAIVPSDEGLHTFSCLDGFYTAPLLAQKGVTDPLAPSTTQRTASSLA